MTQVELARLIATVAHTARGQTRADKVTPYIEHPRRVAQLAQVFFMERFGVDAPECVIAAAWLHDVLEDTKVTEDDLLRWGIWHDTLDIVQRMTKENGNEPATQAYYAKIAESPLAMVVKCADRCANLEDAGAEVVATRGLKRWKRYVEKTVSDVLPMYEAWPTMREQLVERLTGIEAALGTMTY